MVFKGGFGLNDGFIKIKRALVSVSNKSKLLYLAEFGKLIAAIKIWQAGI